MSHRGTIAGAVIVVIGLATVAVAQPAFTVDEMLKLKRISDPQLSPDGTRIVYVQTDVNQSQNTRANDLYVVSLAGGTPTRFASSDRSEDRPRWSPDGSRLAFVSTRSGSAQIWVADARTGQAVRITSLATEAYGVTWSPDGRWLAFVSDVYPGCADLACNEKELAARESSKVSAKIADGLLFRHWTTWKEGRFSHLFVVPADGSVPPRDLTPGAADVPPFSLGGPDDYAFSPDSNEIAYAKKTDPVEAISTNSDIFVLEFTKPGAVAKQVSTSRGADGGPQYTPDGRYLTWRMQERPGFEADRWQLVAMERASGRLKALWPTFDRAIDAWVFGADSRTVYLTAEDEGASKVFRGDLSGAINPVPVLATGGSYGDVQIVPGGKTLVFTRASLTAPTEVFTSATDGSGVSPVTTVNNAFLATFALKPAESITYDGAAGARIQAWVIKPNSFKPGVKYPLLYLVHGGPQGAWTDAWTYRWNAQVFASAGFVVVAPNPRGSTGFGQRFTDDISKDWGGKVFEDLMKGADVAERLPYVDASRTAAAGASYGGYAMNWFLGHTDRFKAVVSHAGVFNLTSMYGVTEELWFPEWEVGGTPWDNRAEYEKWSPHMYAANFKTPTLVTHGELDFRVPVGEGYQLFTTLQRRGVPSRLLVFPDEGHWINKPQNSALWYNTFLEWITRWTK